MYSENCDCFAGFLQASQDLVAQGHRLCGASRLDRSPSAPRVKAAAGSRRVTVRVEVPPAQLIDANGNVVQELPGQGEICESLLLQPSGAGGAYQIHDYFVPEQCARTGCDRRLDDGDVSPVVLAVVLAILDLASVG